MLDFSAPPGALPWLPAVLLAAWIGQVIGERLVGAGVSGFFGALAMTPIGAIVSIALGVLTGASAFRAMR